jgi:hypothetical protein
MTSASKISKLYIRAAKDARQLPITVHPEIFIKGPGGFIGHRHKETMEAGGNAF